MQSCVSPYSLNNELVLTVRQCVGQIAQRIRFLVKAPRNVPLQAVLRDWAAAVPLAGNVRLVIDIDPQSFF